MSPVITKAFAVTESPLETHSVAATKAATSKFERARTHAESPSDPALTQVTSQQASLGPNAPLQGNSAPSSPTALLSPKLEQMSSSITTLSNRVAAVGGSGSTGPLRGRLESLENQFRRVGSNVKVAGPQTDPMQLLKLQHEIYQIDEELEVLSKVVEQAANGVKSVLQTQI